MSAPLLDVAHLTIRFGGLAAVDDVSFAVAPGAIHALIGPNGAGKTTLFNLLSGVTAPSAGIIRLEGESIESLPTWQRTRRGIARTFQNIRMFRDMSVLENVMTGMHSTLPQRLASILARTPGLRAQERDARDEAFALLDEVGLPQAAARRAGDLPYGEQRRLEIARALAAHPKLLLLDEPVAGMNPSEQHDLAGLLRRLNKRGLTILLVEHDMGFVMSLSSCVTVLNFGRKIAEGSPDAVHNDQAVIEAYLGTDAALHE